MPTRAHLHDLHLQAVVKGKLADAISYNVKEFVSMQDGAPLAIVAWHGRNLLELLIWTEYCIKSGNAAGFALDAIRDLDDIIKLVTPEELDTVTPEDRQQFESLMAARAGLTNEVVVPEDLSKRYTSERTAADEIGKLPYYKKIMKVFSKWAHPTALVVMIGRPSADVMNSSRIVMTKLALEMAAEACTMGKAFGDELRCQLTETSAKG